MDNRTRKELVAMLVQLASRLGVGNDFIPNVTMKSFALSDDHSKLDDIAVKLEGMTTAQKRINKRFDKAHQRLVMHNNKHNYYEPKHIKDFDLHERLGMSSVEFWQYVPPRQANPTAEIAAATEKAVRELIREARTW